MYIKMKDIKIQCNSIEQTKYILDLLEKVWDQKVRFEEGHDDWKTIGKCYYESEISNHPYFFGAEPMSVDQFLKLTENEKRRQESWKDNQRAFFYAER